LQKTWKGKNWKNLSDIQDGTVTADVATVFALVEIAHKSFATAKYIALYIPQNGKQHNCNTFLADCRPTTHQHKV
jgi:hypothetical protein